jgi:hypothetical protein
MTQFESGRAIAIPPWLKVGEIKVEMIEGRGVGEAHGGGLMLDAKPPHLFTASSRNVYLHSLKGVDSTDPLELWFFPEISDGISGIFNFQDFARIFRDKPRLALAVEDCADFVTFKCFFEEMICHKKLLF